MKELISKLEEELRLAMIESNVEVLDKLIDNSLAFTSPNGTIATKQMDLSAHKSKIQKIINLQPSNQNITLHDNIAVVTVKMDLKGNFADIDISGQYQYLRVWQNKNGNWKIIAGSVTKILV